MPTVLRTEGFRFFFYSSDRAEPPHIHVEKGYNAAKVWLNPGGEQDDLVGSWNEYFEK